MTTLQDGARQDPAQGAEPGADGRAWIETTLADYPHLSGDRLDELIAWFKTEASALDVAMVASNPAIAEPYRRFRADHIDRLTRKDLLRGIVAVALVALVVIAIVWRSL